MVISNAKDFLDHIRAGLTLAGQDYYGDPEWIGRDKNFTLYYWLSDNVYDHLPDKGQVFIDEYLGRT